MRYVLFVCNHNAGRSRMAPPFFGRHAPEDVRAQGRVRELNESKLDAIRSDPTAHRLRLHPRFADPLRRRDPGELDIDTVRAIRRDEIANHDLDRLKELLP